ncbi:anti-sigma factor domain-containing protein [Glutamicibacter sp. PS]|uniref:anti-sigma factor domain-containing protein n=1 Tax=Glutamicibacter sp. PS TaxID=3075634 RepID=UPI00284AF647|nr:anti-sigma factor [Glutamicibacter sp. PS]MDR4532370.1 anti-sigma factor [Glutamicibacter sp. PS]
MNGSYNQHRDETPDDDLGLDLVDEVAQTSRAAKPRKAKRLVIGVVVAILVVVVALVGYSLLNKGPNPNSVADAKDAVTVSENLANGGAVSVSTSEKKDALAVQLQGLPELDESETYVVWAITEDGAVNAILSSQQSESSGSYSPLKSLIAVNVTRETGNIPSAPSGDSLEASVNLPLDPAQQKSQEESPAPAEQGANE